MTDLTPYIAAVQRHNIQGDLTLHRVAEALRAQHMPVGDATVVAVYNVMTAPPQYPGNLNVPSVVDTPPTGDGHRDEFILWRKRLGGGWFRETVACDIEDIKAELRAEAEHGADVSSERYRLVKVTITEHAEEVDLP